MIIPPPEIKTPNPGSNLNLSDLDDKMKSLSDVVSDLRKSYDHAGEKSEEKTDKLKKAAINLKDLIGSFEMLVSTQTKVKKSEVDEEFETTAGQLIESIGEIKQNFRQMEDRFASLNKVAGDAPAANTAESVA